MSEAPKDEDQFAKFRQLLADTYMFPANYQHKFIGKNSPIFQAAVGEFEGKFVGLKRTGEKQSASGNHLALTYDFLAGSAEDVIELAKATYLIADLIYIL
jgi:putative lipoic acid-binding regulatory protein